MTVSTRDVPGQCPSAGNPIFPMTGAKVQTEDLGVRLANQPLQASLDTRWMLSRTAPSSGMDATFPLQAPRAFGGLWQSSFHKRLIATLGNAAPGAPNTGVAVTLGGIDWETFSADSGHYASDIDPGDRLGFANGTWTLLSGARLRETVFDSTGAATQEVSAQGERISFAYSTDSTPPTIAPEPGLLISASDAFGRSIGFTYERAPTAEAAPRIRDITGPDGSVTHLGYDSLNRLASVTWPNEATRAFAYADNRFAWALTNVIDESAHRYATFGYAADGSAASTEHAGGVDKYTVTYTAPPQWGVTDAYDATNDMVHRTLDWRAPVGPVLTGPDQQPIELGVQMVAGMPRMSTRSQPAGSGCAASTRAFAFDPQGNVTADDDFNGHRSCYAYDDRHRRTRTLGGLPATKACPASLQPSSVDADHPERLTSTQWHPDWTLKVREAEPLRITSWVYNGQPDPVAGGIASCAPSDAGLPDGQPIAVLCRRYEQATDDTDGSKAFSPVTVSSTRTWRYTYNAFGQVLTQVEPKAAAPDPDAKSTTSYAYYSDTTFSGHFTHTAGDLQSVTNARGQTTRYLSYDKAGRPLAVEDAQGVTTTWTYWPRGWPRTQTVTPPQGEAQTSTYDYTPTGLLKTATLPNGSTLSFTYDDAHRLTDVTDSAGNTAHYTLDAMGKVLGQQIKDASGVLAATITNTFDALDRVQTSTGARP